MNEDDRKIIDQHIVWLTERTLPQGDHDAHSEMDTQQRIRVRAVELDCVLWRNNTGVLLDVTVRSRLYKKWRAYFRLQAVSIEEAGSYRWV